MALCVSCGKQKGKRACPALGGQICSVCCGTKRQKEIECPAGCVYLNPAGGYQAERAVSREIAAAFRSEEDDVFQDPVVALSFAAPIESGFAEAFSRNPRVLDRHIGDALVKAYRAMAGETDWPTPSGPLEETVFQIVRDADKACSQLTREQKALTLLRILRSIKKFSRGDAGSRTYLMFIGSEFKSGRIHALRAEDAPSVFGLE